MCHKINIKYDIKIYPKKEIKDDIEINTKIYPRPVRKHGRFWRWMIREGSGFPHPSASSAHPYITRIGIEDRIPGNISPLPNNPLMDLVNDDETFVVFVKIVLLEQGRRRSLWMGVLSPRQCHHPSRNCRLSEISL